MFKFLVLLGLLEGHFSYSQSLLITSFGAKGDGKTLNTQSIQKAIDQASQNGGVVVVPSGRFLTGTLHLKNRVNLHLAKNAVLLGSTNWHDYEKNRWYALLLADGQKNLSITGQGTIDGQGKELGENVMELVKSGEIKDSLHKSAGSATLLRAQENWRPLIIELSKCDQVRVSGITLTNSSGWLQNYIRCTRLEVDSITVRNTVYWNEDGIDITDCKEVKIHDCTIDAADDGVCLKSGYDGDFCDNVEVWNCRIRTSATALKFGTASRGGFKNVKAHHLYVYDNYRTAIGLDMVDGGVLENVDIHDVEAKNSGGALFLRLGARRKASGSLPSVLRNVSIRNLKVDVAEGKPDKGYGMEYPVWNETYNRFPSSIVGIPGMKVENVTLENIEIHFGGGRTKPLVVDSAVLNRIPEKERSYPEFSMFGELPAWGLYVRHAAGIKINNIKLFLKKADTRPAFVFDDVSGLNASNLSIKGGGVPSIITKGIEDPKLELKDTSSGQNIQVLKL